MDARLAQFRYEVNQLIENDRFHDDDSCKTEIKRLLGVSKELGIKSLPNSLYKMKLEDLAYHREIDI